MKRILSIILALTMCISMAATVFAAEMKFTDVKKSDWFYDDVKSAVEMGLINGKSTTTYAPNDNLTYAEAIKLAACMNQLYNEGAISLASGSPWYKPYVDYCIDEEIIDKEYNYTENATRAGYMGIFAKALPDEGLEAINNVPDNSIPDVPSSRAYAAGVYKLYRAGILTGIDDAHNCNPLANITRAEVAAILTRMMNEDKRVSITDMGTEEDKKEETKPEEKEPEEVTNPEETKPEEKEPEKVTDPETTEPENSENNESSGGAKDKFHQAETVEDTADKGFLMYAEDVFYVTGKGIVATGRIIKGELKKGDAIKIISADGSETEATVAGIEMFHKNLDEAKKGDNIGLLLSSEIEKGDVVRGDALIGADAGYDVANTLVGTLTLLTKEEGGRTTAIEEEFSPQFYYANDVTGVITGLTDGTMNPGETQENITVKFTSHKGVWYVGQTLEVRQAGRTLGTFIVTKIGSSSSRHTGSRPSTTTRPSTTRPTTKVALKITTQPTSKSSTLSATELFTVEATGGGAPYTYQWYAVTTVAGKTTNVAMSDTGVTISGAKTATLSLRPTTAGTTTFYCVVTDANGDTVKSNNVTLTVTASTSGGRGSLPSGKADGGYY